MQKYKIADVVFELETVFPYTHELCKDYRCVGDEKPTFAVKTTRENILFEYSTIPSFPLPYLESLAVYRQICDRFLKNFNAIIFHSSAISVDGNAYLFTAPSGTGKSTHARLWREMLGDRAVMVNDDKPIIRFVDGAFYVYGTPWDGKHHLSRNMREKIRAICFIEQAQKNVIKEATLGEVLVSLFNQTMRPSEKQDVDNLFALLEELLKNVKLYKMGCNISREAAITSFEAMSGEKIAD